MSTQSLLMNSSIVCNEERTKVKKEGGLGIEGENERKELKNVTYCLYKVFILST